VAEKVILLESYSQGESIEVDMNRMSTVATKDPNYFIFRLESTWLLVLYAPDDAAVRQRMIYAASLENVKLSLGNDFFREEMRAGEPGDLTYQAYLDHKQSLAAGPALTESEKLFQEEKMLERPQANKTDGVHGVLFPCTDALEQVLRKLGDPTMTESVFLVSVVIDEGKERLDLEYADSRSFVAEEIMTSVSDPRYFFIVRNGVIVFLYYCPDSAPIKRKMLYSTARPAILEAASHAKIAIKSRAEGRDASDLTDDVLFPPQSEEIENSAMVGGGAKSFSKPKPPGGARRRPPPRT
jgi:twinfilin